MEETKQNWPQYTEKMIDNVKKILESGKVNQWTGTKVKEFEKKYQEYFGIKYAVAVMNGTVALELCMKSIDLQYGDEVIVTSRSFFASASSISVCGGKPVFVDVDEKTQNITLETIKTGISHKTKAVILVHLAGLPCDCEEIVEWCHSKNIYVIEDCAQSHGSKYNGKYTGTFGDINAWSFCQDKIISTGGEGGMVTTNNEILYKKAWSYKDHGKNFDKMTELSEFGFFRYVHDTIGTNWRMAEIQASIGIDSLDLLDDWIKARRKNAFLLSECLKKFPFIEVLEYDKKYYHSYYKFYFYVKDDIIGKREVRNLIISKFNENGIIATQGSCSEIYNEKYYLDYVDDIDNFKNNQCDIARKIFDRCIMLQVDPTYTGNIMGKHVAKINDILDDIQKKMLLILGCGQHSQVTTDVALDDKYYVLGYLDDNYENLKNYNYRNIKCIGTFDVANKQCVSNVICGVGNLDTRIKIINKFGHNARWISLIHSSAILSKTSLIKHGTLVMPRVIVNSNTIIGEHNILNSGAIIEHDCQIGNNVHIAPNSTICGGVNVGNNVLIGANSVIKNSSNEKKIYIGDNAIIGIGSVIVKNVDNNMIGFGNPFRISTI